MKKKNHDLHLKDILTKEPKKTTRNQKKIDQFKIIIIIEKTKIKKLDLKNKIESHKNFDNMTKEKKRSKRTKLKYLYIQIKHYVLN